MPWWRQINEWQERFPLYYADADGGAIKPQNVVEQLRDAAPVDTIVVAGVGQHQMWASQYWNFEHPYTWVNSGGAGTMGFAVPGRHRGQGGPAGPHGLGHRRRRLLPDDGTGAGHGELRADPGQDRHPEQRLPGHGPPVAGDVLRGALLRGVPLARPARLREVGRGHGLRGHPGRDARGRRAGHREGERHRRPAGRGRLPHRRLREGVPDGAGRRVQRRHRRPPRPGGGRDDAGPAERTCGRTAVRRAPRHHILSVLVENKAGVLARVAGLFSRRGFNIYSLAVAPTDEDEHFSRITIVVDVESAPLEQVIMQLDKLVNVVSIGELSPAEAVERELVLVTVAVGPTERSQVIQLVGVFGGEVVSVGADRLTVMLAGRPEKIDDFEGLLEHYTVVELQRTGRVALPKLERH